MPVILFQGLRYDVGTDYGSYASISEGIGTGAEGYVNLYRGEPLFGLFMYLCYILSGRDRYFYFFADAVVMNVLLFSAFRFFREYEDGICLPAMYFMYYMLCFPYFLNIERQGMAVIIVWFAMRYVLKRKPARFTLCILLAGLVHKSALVCLILYPLYVLFARKKLTGVGCFAIVASLLAPVVFGLGLDFLSMHLTVFASYRYYFEEDIGVTFNTNWAFGLFLMLMLLLFYGVLRVARLDSRYLLLMFALMLSSYAMNFVSEIAERMALYFEFALIYGYSYVVSNLRRRENRILFRAFWVAIMLFHFTFKFYVCGIADLFPYQTVLMAAGA